MKTILIIVLFMLFYSTASADNYRWVNDRGVINFTDNPLNVPPEILKESRFEFSGMNATTEATLSTMLRILKYQQNADENLHRNLDRIYEYRSRNDRLMVMERMSQEQSKAELERLNDRISELESSNRVNRRRPYTVGGGHH